MWVQNLFTSFNTDDAELASISLRSSLADVNALVEGGEFGTPFSIGEYGFYAQNQFDDQAQLLSDKERKNANNKYFLSEGEWNLVDAYLKKVAHYSNSVFETVRRGDTFAALAVKKNAFHVAIALLQNGLDPLLENEADDDLFRIAKQQYLVLTVQMKELSSVMDRAVYNPKTLKQDWHALDAQEIAIFTALEGMIDFLVELKGNLERRLVQIDNDKKVKRRCELLNEVRHEPICDPPELT